MKHQLEKIANDVLSSASLGGAVDIYSLCKSAQLEVRVGPARRKATVLGRTIVVPGAEPPERQRFAVAHEIAHLLLRDRGIRDTEWRCNWLASSLLHPDAWFLERLRVRGWDLRGLREDFPFSSYEAIGRRVVNLGGEGGAALWVCDRGPSGRTSRRYCSWGTPAALARKPTRVEWDLVARAARDQRPRQLDAVGAWPLPGARTMRVIALGRVGLLAPFATDLARS